MCVCVYVCVYTPLSVAELGDAVVSSAGGVGTLHGRLGGYLRPHALHQTLQLGSWRRRRTTVREGELRREGVGEGWEREREKRWRTGKSSSAMDHWLELD